MDFKKEGRLRYEGKEIFNKKYQNKSRALVFSAGSLTAFVTKLLHFVLVEDLCLKRESSVQHVLCSDVVLANLQKSIIHIQGHHCFVLTMWR